MPEPQEKPRRSALPWVLWLFTLAAVVAGAWFAKQRYDDETAQKDIALAQADGQSVRAMNFEATARALQDKLDALEHERAELATRNEELSSTLEQREAELARLTATYKALEDKMQAEIKRGDIHVTQVGGRIQVDLVDKVLFDSGKAEVSTRGEEVLTRLGAVLATVEDKQIQVSGHTDDSPMGTPELKEKYPTNWELSAARAVNVVRFLAEKASVPPSRLIAAGHGQYQPIATNATPKGRALNRRIEILLLPSLEAKARALPAPDAGAPAKGKGK